MPGNNQQYGQAGFGQGGYSSIVEPPYTIESYPLSVPQIFSNIDGSAGASGFGQGGFGQGGFGGSGGIGPGTGIFGVIDGTNPIFTTNVICRKFRVFRNGQALTQNLDYNAGSNCVIFLGAQIPQVGDTLSIAGYPA